MNKPLIGYKMKTHPDEVAKGEEYHEMFCVVDGDMTLRYWRCHNNGRDHDKENE